MQKEAGVRSIRGWRGVALVGLLCGAALAGCGDDSTGPNGDTGIIEGTVSLTQGQALVNGRLEVYSSLTDLQSGEEDYQTALQGAPPQYSFRLEGVVPGLYVLSICASTGALEDCEAVSTDGVRISEFEVRGGRTLTLSIRL